MGKAGGLGAMTGATELSHDYALRSAASCSEDLRPAMLRRPYDRMLAAGFHAMVQIGETGSNLRDKASERRPANLPQRRAMDWGMRRQWGERYI
jgi:hypothetical protein